MENDVICRSEMIDVFLYNFYFILHYLISFSERINMLFFDNKQTERNAL